MEIPYKLSIVLKSSRIPKLPQQTVPQTAQTLPTRHEAFESAAGKKRTPFECPSRTQAHLPSS